MDSSGQYLTQSASSSSVLQSTQLPSPSELGLPYRGNVSPPSQYAVPSSYNRPAPASPTQGWTPGSPNEGSPSPRRQDLRPKPEPDEVRALPQQKAKSEEDNGAMPVTSDFVKKLYRMLEDGSFSDVVCWGPHGDCFVIKDLNEFTKSILPRMFKHSNFASFVRQLNKYDFHKVKNTDDNELGEHIWMFRHPDFHVGGREALENIKRKVPGNRKASRSGTSPTPGSAPLESLKIQLERMTRQQDEMTAHIRNLEADYENVLGEMVTFQRNLSQQDGLMQNLVQYFLQLENAKLHRGQSGEHGQGGMVPDVNPFLQGSEVQQMMGASSYSEMDIARASLGQMSEISRRAESAGMTFTGRPSSSSLNAPSGSQPRRVSLPQLPPGTPGPQPASRQEALARIAELSRTNSAQGMRRPLLSGPGGPAAPVDAQGAFDGAAQGPWAMSAKTLAHEGLEVYTVGHLMPRSAVDDQNGNWTFDPASVGTPGAAGPSAGGGAGAGAGEEGDVVMPTPQGRGGDPAGEDEQLRQQPLVVREGGGEARASTGSTGGRTLRVRRATYVPAWAVPPKVLLVDDDAISRKLSSKFLQIFGCAIDVAVDGVGAVNKMNLEKYDLVLMDIVMPKLDGISATSLIRQFDPMTPIISMTSNAKPTEVIKYYSSGMNDILPKPFTKDGLLGMLEKHLTHLKVIQTMAKLPRALGLPPMSDPAFAQVMAVQAAKAGSGRPSSRADARINPLAGMGLSDEQYTAILQSMVSAETFDDGTGAGASSGAAAGAGGRGYGGKRGLDDAGEDHYSKRSRFEEIE